MRPLSSSSAAIPLDATASATLPFLLSCASRTLKPYVFPARKGGGGARVRGEHGSRLADTVRERCCLHAPASHLSRWARPRSTGPHAIVCRQLGCPRAVLRLLRLCRQLRRYLGGAAVVRPFAQPAIPYLGALPRKDIEPE